MKALFLYSGTRKNRQVNGINFNDTQLYGMNHMAKFSIDAENKEFNDLSKSKFLNRLLGFRIKHALLYFLVKDYDIVFGSSILYMMFFNKFFKKNSKFILFNISLTRTLAANKNNFLKFLVLKWLLKNVDAVVCLSNIQKKYLEENFDFLKNKIFFVPLGVDFNYYKPVYNNRKQYVLSVGRDNGRDYRTVMEVAKKFQEMQFHIVCSRRNLSGINSIPDNVIVFNDISREDLEKKYYEAKMLLLTTHDDQYLDGSDCSGQTVLLEAMASGLPIIVSKKRYLDDYIVDGKDALLVNFYDVEDIANKIIKLGSDDIARQLSYNARNKVEFIFSTELMAKRLSDIFYKISER